MGDEIREGFLCPICLKDLRSPTHLTTHFEEFHADEKDVLQQLRSVFGKAKKKFMSKDVSVSRDVTDSSQPDVPVSRGTPGSGGIDLTLWEAQKLGQTSDHMKAFRQQRKETIERCVVETNKLLIRLEKLVKSGVYLSDSSLPNAIKARRNLEKAAVPWENDKDAKLCPHCFKKFSLTYRKHHCRLCGKVICERCLMSLDMYLACDVLKLDENTATSYVKLERNSDDENGLKACKPCNALLIRQNQLIQDKSANSLLLQLYERMHLSMREADSIQPKFLKMADSVIAGETEFGLEAAMESRVKLLRKYESVEALSKRIQLLGMDKDKQPHPQILKLQRSIRAYASNYLADNMFTLPALPTQDKYDEMLKQKQKERERLKAIKTQNVHQQKIMKNNEQQQKVVRNNNSPVSTQFSQRSPNLQRRTETNQSKFSGGSLFRTFTKENRPVFQAVSISKKDTSWGPVQVSTDHTSDPIVQQIENVKGYINQAIKDKKFDEVEMFEHNLKELELIYLEQRKVMHE